MILVTGASGQVGGAVLRELIKRGERVRAFYRSDKDNAPAGAEKAVGDFNDAASMERALKGIERVFLVSGPTRDIAEVEGRAADACKRAGVRHLVKLSALGAGEFNASFPALHFQSEQHVRGLGVPFTIVRPNSFMQNIAAYFAPTIRTQGAFYNSFGNARVAWIDVRDIAEAAANILARGDHAGKTYHLDGPEAPTLAQLADQITSVTGTAAKYVDLPPDALRGGMLQAGMPAWQADALVELARYYRENPNRSSDPVLKTLLGHEPRTLQQFLGENKASFAKAASA